MATVTVTIPGLLDRFTDGCRAVPLRAETVASAIDALFETYPALEPHLVDGDGRLRPHVILVHDGATVEWSDSPSVTIDDGDEVVVLQAVSGG